MIACDHYWRDGIGLVEHDEPDLHRETCVVCHREHKARQDLVHALPLVGSTVAGDPDWEAQVWSRIARLQSPRSVRWRRVGAGFAAACALVVTCWALGRRDPEETRPRIEVVPSEVAMRSTSPSVGDRVRIAVDSTDEVRIYRGDRLVLRCRSKSTSDGCTSEVGGMIAEAVLATVGEYRLVIISSRTAEPVGGLDRDLRAISSAGGVFRITYLMVQ